MDLSGDLFDILPRCFNMDTLVQCLAGRRVISDAEYERIRSTGQMELSNIIRKNDAFKNFITAIREFTFEIIGVLQLAMDTALRPASEQGIKRPVMPHATEHFTSREKPGFTDLSQLDACQNSQESTSSTESFEGMMEHQCKVDSDYYTMESSKSRSSRFFSPSTTRKHNRKSRKENEISVISPKRGLKVNSGYQKQQQQQQQRQDCYCVHGQSCHTCSTRGEGVIIEESAAKTHNVLGESCDTSHNAGQWSKDLTNSRDETDKDLNPAGDAYEEFKRKYYSECVKYLSLCPLIPYLVQEGLLTNDENEKLTNPQYSETEKIQYLLSSVLGKKGPDVVQCFKRCIARETQHKGHVHLTTLFHSCDIRPCDCY